MKFETKKSAYKKHWKDHPIQNLFSLFTGLLKKSIKAFFIYGIAFFGLLLLLVGFFNGLMSAVNILESVLIGIRSNGNIDGLLTTWAFVSIFFLIVDLILNPIKTQAHKVSKEEKTG